MPEWRQAFDGRPRLTYSYTVEDGISRERDELLSSLLRFLAVAGLIAYLPGVVAGVVERLWLVVAVDTAAYAAVISVAFSSRSSHTAKLAVLVVASLATGAVVLVMTGPLGAGYIWFVAAVVMSALFGDGRVVNITIGLTAAIMSAWIAALAGGAEGHGATPVTVVIIAGSLLLICMALSMVIRRLLESISAAFAEKAGLAESLAEELRRSIDIRGQLETNLTVKVSLLKELQHRVRNNLQTVISLLSLDDGSAEDRPSDAIRRIRALSIANDVFLSDPDRGLVEARSLVRAVAQMAADDERAEYCGIESVGDEPLELDSQTASMVAVLVSDLVAGLVRDGGVPLVGVDVIGGRLRVCLSRRDADREDAALAGLYRSVAESRMARGAAPDVRIELRREPGSCGRICLEANAVGRSSPYYRAKAP